MTDSDVLDGKSAVEQAQDKRFSTVAPGWGNKSYENLVDDLEARHAYAESAVKRQGKEALEELYHSEFPIENPPDSFERYEAELAVRHLRQSIETMFGDVENDPGHRRVVVESGAEGDDVKEVGFEEATERAAQRGTEVSRRLAIDLGEVEMQAEAFATAEELQSLHVKQAKNRIDVMKTYGQLAEPHIAALTHAFIHSDVRAYATETLAELRGADDEGTKSLTAAIRDWWRGD